MDFGITIVICFTIYAKVVEICVYLKHKKDKENKEAEW